MKKADFRLEFNAFASMGNRIEASFVVDPTFELVAVEDMRMGEDTVRGLTLIFRRSQPHQLGRRIFTLKKEFERLPTGEVTFDSSDVNKESKNGGN